MKQDYSDAILAGFFCSILLFCAICCLAYYVVESRKKNKEKTTWKRYNTGVWDSCTCGRIGCEICYPGKV